MRQFHLERRTEERRATLPQSYVQLTQSGEEFVMVVHNLAGTFTTFLSAEQVRQAWETFGAALQAQEVSA